MIFPQKNEPRNKTKIEALTWEEAKGEEVTILRNGLL